MVHTQANIMFNIATYAVLPGWAALVLAPAHELTELYVRLCAMSLSLLYVASLALGGQPGGNFTTLPGVCIIFRKGSDLVLNGCWIHYLIFDMVVGSVIAADGHKHGVSQLVMAPFLFLTLMFGPAGFTAFHAFKFATL